MFSGLFHPVKCCVAAPAHHLFYFHYPPTLIFSTSGFHHFFVREFNWASTQTGNNDPSEIPLCGSLREFHGTSGLLSIDFGMKEWNEFNPGEIVRKYRQFVYETGAAESQEPPVKHPIGDPGFMGQAGVSLRPIEAYAPEGGQRSVKREIDPKIVEKARKKGYRISRAERFRYRCRYFTRLNRPEVYGFAVFNRVNSC